MVENVFEVKIIMIDCNEEMIVLVKENFVKYDNYN